MNAPNPLVSVVIIGRNEGDRLIRCLDSVARVAALGWRLETIYVDSASTDESVARACAHGARVIEVTPERPCAAVGRNAGWRAAAGQWILFLDGDTELEPQFLPKALESMETDTRVGVVWGHRRELAPDSSVYNRVLDFDWIYPAGDSAFCGGDALMRRDVLMAVGGFDEGCIAGEEPELCRRIRAHGFRIEHIDVNMTRHDLAIHDFGAYWRRAFRAGHAYAHLAARFGRTSDPLWSREARRNLVHGSAIMLLPVLLATLSSHPAMLIAFIALGALAMGRSMSRCAWKAPRRIDRLYYTLHSHFQQVPILFGQLAWHRDHYLGQQRGLIEYK